MYKKKKNLKRELKAGGWKWNHFMVNSHLHEYKMKYNYKVIKLRYQVDKYVKNKEIN